MHLEGTQPRIECIICHGVEKFHRVEQLAEHISSKHGTIPQACPMCDKVKWPYSAFKLAKHIKRYHQSYKCDICSREFEDLFHLNLHIHTHRMVAQYFYPESIPMNGLPCTDTAKVPIRTPIFTEIAEAHPSVVKGKKSK